MSHHERTNPDAAFDLPDKITVRQQLAYFGAAISTQDNADWLLRYWNGARQIILNWQCEIMPNLDFDPDDVTDPQVTNIIIWAALQVKQHMDALEELPKN